MCLFLFLLYFFHFNSLSSICLPFFYYSLVSFIFILSNWVCFWVHIELYLFVSSLDSNHNVIYDRKIDLCTFIFIFVSLNNSSTLIDFSFKFVLKIASKKSSSFYFKLLTISMSRLQTDRHNLKSVFLFFSPFRSFFQSTSKHLETFFLYPFHFKICIHEFFKCKTNIINWCFTFSRL